MTWEMNVQVITKILKDAQKRIIIIQHIFMKMGHMNHVMMDIQEYFK